MDDWQRYGYASYEAFISSKAGASPARRFFEHEWNDDWPMPKPPPFAADDEDDDTPEPGASA